MSSGSFDDLWTAEDADPLHLLESMRRATSAAVVVSDGFCAQPGLNVSSVLSAGADGFEVGHHRTHPHAPH